MKFGIYRNLKNLKLYEVINVGRHVKNPNNISVIYRQLYSSKLRDTNEILNYGSIWIRDLEDFNNKFAPLK